jgi:hypothetical protein
MSSSSPSRFGLRASIAAALALVACKEPLDPAKSVASVAISPRTAQLYAVQQQVTFSVVVTTDAGGTPPEGTIPVSFVSRDPTLVAVDAQGVATALRMGGSTWIVAAAGGKSDSARVEVPATTCGAVTPTPMAVGQVVTDIGAAGFCAAATGGEYVVIVHNTSLTTTGASSVDITGVGLGAASAFGAVAPGQSSGSLSLASSAALRHPRDVGAEMAHRRAEAAAVAPFAAGARAWYASRPRRAAFNAAPPAVGDVMTINVNIGGTADANGCTDARNDIAARVAAVSNTAIVLDDPRNPRADGYTDAEYARFAAMFDSVIYPLDTTQFGKPTDLDGNERVLLVFTKAVNERTPAGASYYVGGLTHSRDLLPKAQCAGSNVAEMFYLLVPDSLGTVNGNSFMRKSFVDDVTDVTVAHEFQHMINFARRRYLLSGAAPSEELWLNEGLSHVAEELLYYRMTGRAPRTNIGYEAVGTSAAFESFLTYFVGEFLNYDEYMSLTTTTSPFGSGDALRTRGAIWAFLRYVVDQKLQADGRVWYDFVNAGDAGLTNLQKRFGVDEVGLRALLRDFEISAYADDHVTDVNARFTQPSWNLRAMYAGLQHGDGTPFVWPLTGTPLANGTKSTVTMISGGFKVYRFTGLEDADSFVRATGTSGGALPPTITISVIRTR